MKKAQFYICLTNGSKPYIPDAASVLIATGYIDETLGVAYTNKTPDAGEPMHWQATDLATGTKITSGHATRKACQDCVEALFNHIERGRKLAPYINLKAQLQALADANLIPSLTPIQSERSVPA